MSLIVKKASYSANFRSAFSILLSVNSGGEIDTFYHSKNDIFSGIISFDVFLRNLKKQNCNWSRYKNQNVFMLIYLEHNGCNKVTSIDLNDVNNWMALIKDIPALQKDKEVVFLDPLLIYL